MQVKWETNKYAGACNACKSTYAGECNAMHRKVHMQGHAMLCIGKCICRRMQCNAGRNAYAGACNVMHSKVHMQAQCNACIAKVYKL